MGLKNIEKAHVLRLGRRGRIPAGADREQDARAKPRPEHDALRLRAGRGDQHAHCRRRRARHRARRHGRFTIDGEAHLVSAGESIVMPAHVPHAVYGQTRFKMLLTVIV